MQRVLRGVKRWCHDKTLSVNPSKTEMILFTRRYKPEQHKAIYFFDEEVKLNQGIKYLGVILDSKLSWKTHLDSRLSKSHRRLFTVEKSHWSYLGHNPKSCSLAIYCRYPTYVLLCGSYIVVS